MRTHPFLEPMRLVYTCFVLLLGEVAVLGGTGLGDLFARHAQLDIVDANDLDGPPYHLAHFCRSQVSSNIYIWKSVLSRSDKDNRGPWCGRTQRRTK
jgi:hypothetical protein